MTARTPACWWVQLPGYWFDPLRPGPPHSGTVSVVQQDPRWSAARPGAGPRSRSPPRHIDGPPAAAAASAAVVASAAGQHISPSLLAVKETYQNVLYVAIHIFTLEFDKSIIK